MIHYYLKYNADNVFKEVERAEYEREFLKYCNDVTARLEAFNGKDSCGILQVN